MKTLRLHSWSLTPAKAAALQRRLATQVNVSVRLRHWQLVAGADISYSRSSPLFYAGVVLMRAVDLAVVEEATAVGEGAFPYVPGLLSFREAPTLLKAFRKLKAQPDVVMLDGHGYAHPRRMGLACHLGLWLDCPTIGCAKSLLIGEHLPLDAERGARRPIQDGGETVGMAVRTRPGVKPVYISAGHRITLADAVRVVLACTAGWRLPEPTRQAHLLVNRLRTAACC